MRRRFPGQRATKAIRDDTVSIWAAMSNSLADKAAGITEEAAGTQNRVGLLSYFASKQKAYGKLIAAITRRIVRVTSHTRYCRQTAEDERAKTSDTKYVVTHGGPKFACMHDSVSLKLVDAPPIAEGSQQQLSQLRLRILWTTIYVCPIVDVTLSMA